MSVSSYFKGSGEKVMDSMKRRYGPEKGERVFYARATKTGQKPSAKSRGYKKLRERM